MYIILLLSTTIFVVNAQDNLLGCYKDVAQIKRVSFPNYYPKKDCIAMCFKKYYRLLQFHSA